MKRIIYLILFLMNGCGAAMAQDPAPASPTAISPNFTFYKKIIAGDTSYYGYSSGFWTNFARRKWATDLFLKKADSSKYSTFFALKDSMANVLHLTGKSNQFINGNVGLNGYWQTQNGSGNYGRWALSRLSYSNGGFLELGDGTGVKLSSLGGLKLQATFPGDTAGSYFLKLDGNYKARKDTNHYTLKYGTDTKYGAMSFVDGPVYVGTGISIFGGSGGSIQLTGGVMSSVSTGLRLGATGRNGIGFVGVSSEIASFNDLNSLADNPGIALMQPTALRYAMTNPPGSYDLIGRDQLATGGYGELYKVPISTFALASSLGSYVPYSGATANIDLGTHSITANGGYQLTGSGNFGASNAGGTMYTSQKFGGFEAHDTGVNSGYSVFKHNKITWNDGVYDYSISSPTSVTANRNLLFPDNSGTLQLTLDSTFSHNIDAASFSVNKTDGRGVFKGPAQTIIPATPSAGNGIMYFDSGTKFTIMGSNGIAASLSKALMTSNQVYQFPANGGTFAMTSDLSVPANSIVGNATSGAASFPSIAYYDSGEQTYSGTIAWTGTTAPSGTTNHTYQWTRIGKQVTIRLTLAYTVAGTALTEVNIDLPAGLPNPHTPAGFATTDNMYAGFGGMATALVNPITSAARCSIRTASGVYKMRMISGSGNFAVAQFNFTYYTD